MPFPFIAVPLIPFLLAVGVFGGIQAASHAEDILFLNS